MTFRFAILHHTLPEKTSRSSHWDLLLEPPSCLSNQLDFEPGLLTFEVPIPPSRWGARLMVRRLQNHRPIYLDYEGAISKDRGEVIRILYGTIRWQVAEAGLLIVRLEPDRSADLDLCGVIKIRALTDPPNRDSWEMEFVRYGLQSPDSCGTL